MPETDPPRCYALVPCAGVGTRAGSELPKQYVAVAGRALVSHTLSALARVVRIVETLVVLAPDDAWFETAVPEFADLRCRVARIGGATRAETVASGLALLAERARPQDWVLVHDAARCLISPAAVDRLIDACWHDAVGGLLALPLADTLKQEREGRVAATLERAGRWAAQTPQMFRLGLLRDALMQARPGASDESSAVEALGLAPLLIAGEPSNLKLTWPGDFEFARRWLEAAR